MTENLEIYKNLLGSQSWPVKLKWSKNGRRFLSKSKVERKTRLMSEIPPAKIVLRDVEKLYCSSCLTFIVDLIECNVCKHATYCCRDCKAKDAPMHDLVECKLLSKDTRVVEDVVIDANIDYNLLRLLIRCISRQQVGDDDNTPMALVNDMVQHEGNLSDAWMDSIRLASGMLVASCRQYAGLQVSPDNVVKLALKINSNSHGITDFNPSNSLDPTSLSKGTIGICLAPLGCIFNHSCAPNTTYLGEQGGRITFISTKTVQQGQEFLVSYIASDIMPRWERRGALLGTKWFWCMCERCSSSREQEWWLVDANLIAFECQCSGIFLPDEQDEEFNRDLDPSKATRDLICQDCGNTLNVEEYRDLSHKAELDLINLEELVEKKSWTFAGHAATQFFGKWKGKLAPGHSVLLRAGLLGAESWYQSSHPLDFTHSIQSLLRYRAILKRVVWKDRWTAEEEQLLTILSWMVQSQVDLDLSNGVERETDVGYLDLLNQISEWKTELLQ